MNPVLPGKCSGCDRAIFSRSPSGKMYANEFYTEMAFVLSNGSVARHGICRVCAETMTEALKTKIFGRIKASWRQELVGSGNDKQFKNVDSLEAAVYHKDVNEAIKLYKEKTEKERVQKLKVKKQK